jgi:hypothetical protein
MEIRGIEYAASISASEAKREVSRYMERRGSSSRYIFNLQPQIRTEEMRDLLGRMFCMFRIICSTNLCGSQAKNRSSAFVMHFLSLMENLDSRLNPKTKEGHLDCQVQLPWLVEGMQLLHSFSTFSQPV